MEATKFMINELGLNKQSSKQSIIKMINDQINHCKLEYFSKWLGDHTFPSEAKDKEIAILENKKRELEVFFNKNQVLDPTLNFNLSVEANKTHS